MIAVIYMIYLGKQAMLSLTRQTNMSVFVQILS
jgi:hypothetical protein